MSAKTGYSPPPPSRCTARGDAEPIIIDHVTLIDGTGRPPRADMAVVMDGGIRRRRTEQTGARPGRRIDGRGRYLIPGLMDIHIHLAGFSRAGKSWIPSSKPQADGAWTVDRKAGEQALASFLYAGVTTVLDVGNIPENILPLRADERAGKILAPHIFATGNLVTYPGSHGTDIAINVTAWPEAKPQLQAQFDAQHPDVQKITYDDEGWGSRPLIPILPKDLLQHIIEFYNDHGVRTTVHVSNESRAREAIYSGVDTLAHTPIQGPVTDAFVKLAAAKQIPMATTMTIGDNYSRIHEHPEFLDQPLYVATMDPKERARLKKIAAAGGETASVNSPAAALAAKTTGGRVDEDEDPDHPGQRAPHRTPDAGEGDGPYRHRRQQLAPGHPARAGGVAAQRRRTARSSHTMATYNGDAPASGNRRPWAASRPARCADAVLLSAVPRQSTSATPRPSSWAEVPATPCRKQAAARRGAASRTEGKRDLARPRVRNLDQ